MSWDDLIECIRIFARHSTTKLADIQAEHDEIFFTPDVPVVSHDSDWLMDKGWAWHEEYGYWRHSV